MSRLDVVLFGASGYTGRHAVEQLVSIAGRRGLSWAVAGRNREKISCILKEISLKTGMDLSSTKVLVADAQDEQSVQEMCMCARVIVNCCGTYTLHGEVVVRAAIRSGTHYIDVCAEHNFTELMQLRYGQAAREAGVYVVSSCACESIPADLGVIYLQQNFNGVLNSVECYLSSDARAGSYNYGTFHSVVYSVADFNKIASVRKELFQKPLPKLTPELKSRFLIHRRLGGWCLPFDGNDTSTVYRTQRYFYERDGTRPVQIKTYARFRSLWFTFGVILTSVCIFIMKGPSANDTVNVVFGFHLYGVGWDETAAAKVGSVPPRKLMIAEVTGTNAGYGMSVIAALYCAVAVLQEQRHMPPGGGVLTPGAAFSKTSLVKNLQENGVKFKITYCKVHYD